MMKKAICIILCCVTAVIVFVIARIVIVDNANKISIEDFADAEMGDLILVNARIDEEMNLRAAEDVRIEHVENIKGLNIGYTGYYETLTDLQKCINLEKLIIGAPASTYVHYWGRLGEIVEPESVERIAQIEEELGEIVNSCSQLKQLYIRNEEAVCDLKNLDFLQYESGLEWLGLEEMGDIDYSPILECSDLTVLDLWGCNVSELGEISKLENLTHLFLNKTNVAEAGDIVNLKHLEVLMIEDTPLAENEEELALIYEAFPNIELYK